MSTEKLGRDFQQATDKLHDAATKGMGQISSRRAVEQRYSQAYQALVRAGLKPQVRGKYR